MISNISIKNFKSVVDVSLPLGRFNLLIGANGCGKSNILEGIAMGAAASADKLDYEYFANRGIRVVEPRFMTSAFDGIDDKVITLSIDSGEKYSPSFNISYNRSVKPARWETDSQNINSVLTEIKKLIPNGHPKSGDVLKMIAQIEESKEKIQYPIRLKRTKDDHTELMSVNPEISQFLIYSLEESKLRQADNSNRTYPLGRHGEGLFAYLKELSQRPDSNTIFEEIKEHLKILDWFDDLEVPTGQLSMEFNLKLKDSYLTDTLNTFDQRSTNEGFLYLLFYLTLIISDETPRFFAIENIDTAFNPKLCREVTRRLIELARKHNKQIIATTHNPAVLDGMDLYEDDVRLHVVRRSIDGYTKTNRVTLKGDMTMPLSEAWQKGFIGGLPDNF